MEITEVGSLSEAREDYWSCEDIVLITYADSITSDSRTPLETLKALCRSILIRTDLDDPYSAVFSVQFR